MLVKFLGKLRLRVECMGGIKRTALYFVLVRVLLESDDEKFNLEF